ncbi:MAG: ATP synthase subunit I [Pseudomonadota bacterium]
MIVFGAYYLLFYILAFCTLAFWKSWRWFVPASLLVGGLCVWAINDLQTADGPGALFAYAFVGLFMLGAVAGFLGRLIILATRVSRFQLPEKAVLLIVFVAAPLVVWGWTQWVDYQQQNRLRPPSPACLDRMHAVSVGNVALEIPLAPIFSLSEQYDWDEAYFLSSNHRSRAFCERTQDGEPVRLARMSITTGPGSYGHRNVVNAPFCAKSQPYGWWEHLCQKEVGESLQDYPDKITLSEVESYFSENNSLLDSVKEAGSTDLSEIRENMRNKGIGCYETNGYRDDVIHCTAQRMLTDSVQIEYMFRSNQEDRDAHALLMEQRALEIVDSLRAPE